MIQPLLGQETEASSDAPENEEEDVQELIGEEQDAGAYFWWVPTGTLCQL